MLIVFVGVVVSYCLPSFGVEVEEVAKPAFMGFMGTCNLIESKDFNFKAIIKVKVIVKVIKAAT